MSPTGRKNRKKESQSSPRNRYMRRAKLSEYKFLKVLRAFADERSLQETAVDMKLSERSVRNLYDELRGKLMRAVIQHPFDFGWAGYFLFDDLELSARGSHILDTVVESNLMRSYLDRHAPRSGITGIPKQRFSEIVFEVTVRMFCALSMRKDNETLYAPEIHKAYEQLQFIARYILDQQDSPENPAQFEAVKQAFEIYLEEFPALLAKEEFRSLAAGYDWHRFSTDVLYNDLRRYLLTDPIDNTQAESE